MIPDIPEITMARQSGTIGTDGDPRAEDVVETATARALVLAAKAKRWDVVMRIADELRGRGTVLPAGPRPARIRARSNG